MSIENKNQHMYTVSASLKKPEEAETIETEKLTEDELWLQQMEISFNDYSPLSSNFLVGNNFYKTLEHELSKYIVLQKLPKTKGMEISKINYQFEGELNYWVEMFNHYLTLTPTFIFYSNKKDKEYLEKQCDEFWNFLYKPLQEQYQSLIDDIITYNYSPFKIDPNLFKTNIN